MVLKIRDWSNKIWALIKDISMVNKLLTNNLTTKQHIQYNGFINTYKIYIKNKFIN